MSQLKQVIHYKDTNSVEATWLDGDDKQVKCHSYADCQMDMFRADVVEFGGDIAEHEEMIALVEVSIKPYVEPPPKILTTQEQIIALEATVSDRRIREAVLGIDNGWLAGVNAEIAKLRVKL